MPDDRAKLVERLWQASGDPDCGHIRDDLENAAEELSRPRALVEWSAPVAGIVEAHLWGVGMIWSGSVTSAPAHAERWRAAGLDVAEVPS